MQLYLKHYKLVPFLSDAGELIQPNFRGLSDEPKSFRPLPEGYLGPMQQVRRINWAQSFARATLNFSHYNLVSRQSSWHKTVYEFQANELSERAAKAKLRAGKRGAWTCLQLEHCGDPDAVVQGDVLTYQQSEPMLRLDERGSAQIDLERPSRELSHLEWISEKAELDEFVSSFSRSFITEYAFLEQLFREPWDPALSLVSIRH